MLKFKKTSHQPPPDLGEQKYTVCHKVTTLVFVLYAPGGRILLITSKLQIPRPNPCI